MNALIPIIPQEFIKHAVHLLLCLIHLVLRLAGLLHGERELLVLIDKEREQTVIVPCGGGAVIDRGGVAAASHLSDHAVLLAVEEREWLAHGAGNILKEAGSYVVVL
ncbi:MAG: hypothetical protein II229_02680 [Clostridia bacterium]|nr:hypothetical protein [Clostridia bacterium]